MLLDGYWKKDLKSIIKQLERWSGNRCELFHDYAEHKVNQGLLYSAVIIRKIVEDEKDGKKTYDKYWADKPPFPGTENDDYQSNMFATLKYEVPVRAYQHTDTEKFFMNSKLFLPDFDTKNSSEIMFSLDKVCNQLIHSYVWGVVHNSEHNQIFGILVASDNFMKKEMYLLKIEDWIDAIRYVIDNSTI